MPPAEFISFAQNAEDVVLWRALRHVAAGTYVDVGAADPTVDSVTRAFYERGWSGVNVEPVPRYAKALREERPRDQTFELAVGREHDAVRFYVSDETGRSTAMPDVASGTASEGITVLETTVEMWTLDEVLDAAGLVERDIHFCKIDVEGLEADVLAAVDLVRWRPWVLVVEATAPQTTTATHGSWEPSVLERGYTFCLFDGLNRFYVADEHAELRDRLSYPACVFDDPWERERIVRQLRFLEGSVRDLDAARREGDAALGASQARVAELHAQVVGLSGELHSTRASAASANTLVDATRREAVAWRTQVLRRSAEIAALQHHAHLLAVERDVLAGRAITAEAHVDALQATVSWRVTSPLRSARRAQLGLKRPGLRTTGRSARDSDEPAPFQPRESATNMFAIRLAQAAALLQGDEFDLNDDVELGGALEAFEEALHTSTEEVPAKAWLALVTALATYPSDNEVKAMARLLRVDGPPAVVGEVQRQFREAVERGAQFDRRLEVARDATVLDVSHTVSSNLHTGIQRVVRETVTKWSADHDVVMIYFDLEKRYAMPLTPDEINRLERWREHLIVGAPDHIRRVPDVVAEAVVVPWHGQLLVPELAAEPERCEPFRALTTSGVIRRLGLVGYDVIPVTASETVTDGMAANFAGYMSLVKYAHRLSAISEATAHDFHAFNTMLASQGLRGPDVAAHPLPTEIPVCSDRDLEEVRRRLELGSTPLILVVGSHEPRKNHLVVLEAAQKMWRNGADFHLLMIGGSGWRSEEFEAYVDLLQSAHYPLAVWRRAGEADLWASYHVARFSVFPSLIEGYGLPVAESLACGTPVITSDIGSMAEMARGGGGIVTVDPRNVDAVRSAMELLLSDDVELERLRTEAKERDLGSWEKYAGAVWQHLVES
jgi:FkbM family methyltransferase